MREGRTFKSSVPSSVDLPSMQSAGSLCESKNLLPNFICLFNSLNTLGLYSPNLLSLRGGRTHFERLWRKLTVCLAVISTQPQLTALYRNSRYDRDSDRRGGRSDRDDRDRRNRDDDRGSDVLYTRHGQGERKHIKFDDNGDDGIIIKKIVDEEEEQEKEEKGSRFGAIGSRLRGMSGAVSSVIRNFKAIVNKRPSKVYCYNCGDAGHQGQVILFV